MPTAEQELLSEILVFIKRHGMSPTAFGMDVLGDPSLIPTLEEGRSPRLSTVRKIEAYMRGYRAAPQRRAS